MRLTLRTMLAYLDGILEPEDAEDIGRKIQESEYATKLMHRTRDVMRRLRLAAPSLTDRGPGLDPNTVAEYLDNTLSDDRVPDFEKVCLESDMHLAEVACCHQVLTLVLGEPAEIDPASRQRMYRIPQAQAGAEGPWEPSLVAEPQGGKPAGDGATTKPRPKPAIPDYLREPRKPYRWVLPAAAALLLAGCFALPVLLVLGQFEAGTPLGNLLGIRSAETKVAGGPTSADSVAKQPAAPAPGKPAPRMQSPAPATSPQPVPGPEKPAAASPQEPGATGGTRPSRGDTPPEKDAGMTPEPPASSASTAVKVGPAPGSRPAELSASGTKQPEKQPEEASDETIPKPPVEPGVGLPAKGNLKLPAAPGAKSPIAREPEISPPAEPGAAASSAPSAEPSREPPAEPPQPMGRLMSGRQVLLRYDAGGPNWQRIRANGILTPQDRLVALPTYRPEVTLSAGVTLQILGGTEIALLPGAPQQPAGLQIAFGRLVMMPLANPGTRLRLVFGECKGILTFVQAESVVALELAGDRVSGTDPQTEPVHLVANLYAISGEIVWEQDSDRQTVQIRAPARLPIVGPAAQPPVAGKDFPKWIVGEPIAPLDARASTTVEAALQADRPADLVLMELDDHRQKEVRWLAARCEAYLGWFGPMVAVLNQPDAKAEWLDYVDRLRAALARGPETAEAVRKALEKHYPAQEAAELYRMLCGYSEKQLQQGADAELVQFLDHETLAVRLLSICNLREITGGMGLFYSPEQTAAKRAPSVRRWKERLNHKEIRLKPPEGSGKKAAGGGELAPGGPDSGR